MINREYVVHRFQPELITATFIGKDGSCGFKNGEIYKLWFFNSNWKHYISRPRMNAIAIPYDTMKALMKNWRFEISKEKK